MKLWTHASLVFGAAVLSACGPNYHIAKGEEHLAGSRPDAAAQEFQKALDKNPTALAALRGMAAAHIDRDQPVRAIIPAQRAARAGDIESRRLLSQALLTTGRAEDALKAIKAGREEAPDDASFRMLLVRGLTAVGQYDDAASAADEFLIDLSSPEARALHAWTLSRAGKVDSAVAMAADAVAIAADEAMIQAEAAAIFWKGGRKDDFEQANKMARALLPASPRQELQRAKWHAEQGDTETAIRRLEALRGAYTKDGVLAARLGLLYAERGAWKDSARHLSAALRLKPYAEDAPVSGVQLMKTGDSMKEKSRRSEHIEVAETLGVAFTALGKHRNAAAAWQVAVDRTARPTASDYIRVARAWQMGNDVDGMGRSAQLATEQDPSNAEAHFLLAQAYEAANNIEWAIRHGQRAWELSPDKPEVVVFVGKLYEGRGDKRMARELYRDALRQHPSDARIYSAFERVGGARR